MSVEVGQTPTGTTGTGTAGGSLTGSGGQGSSLQAPQTSVSAGSLPSSVQLAPGYKAKPNSSAVQAGGAAASPAPGSAVASPEAGAVRVQPRAEPRRQAGHSARTGVPTELALPPAPGGLAEAESKAPPLQGKTQEAPSGVRSVGLAVEELDKAKSIEKKGGEGSIDDALGKVFDASDSVPKTRSDPKGGESGARAAEAPLPDVKALGPEKALEKVNALAETASDADAQRLYRHALEAAKELPPEQSAAESERVVSRAAGRAPKAVPSLARQALESAAAGRALDAQRYSKALSGWNSLLTVAGEPYVSNLADFQTAVDRVGAQASASKGKTLPVPKAAVRTLPGKVRPRLELKAILAPSMASDLPAVPAGLARSLVLPEARSAVSWEPVSVKDGAEFKDSFRLPPRAGPAALFRARRAEGNSFFSALRMASRQWFSGRVGGFLARLRGALLGLLRSLGLLDAPFAAEGVRLDASPEALAALRALPAREFSLPEPARTQENAQGLGTTLFKAR